MKRTGAFAGCSLEGGGLVLDGQSIKLRLQHLAGANGPVHVDWLRFSVPRASVMTTCHYVESQESLFEYTEEAWDVQTRLLRLRKMIDHVCLDRTALAAARVLAREVVQILGSDFEVDHEPSNGRDFFAFRLPVRRCGVEVGWIGSGASSIKNQAQQGNVVHVNLYGEACLFISQKAMSALAQLGQRLNGWVTRCDLALDFWKGIEGGMEGLNQFYVQGDMDVRGKRPKVAHHGDWINKRACTFYLGSRDAGKLTRVYLKGDQLFGLEASDPWTRVELQWGDQLRILPWDMLVSPAQYFAGASDWHAEMLAQAKEYVLPVPVTCEPAAAPMTAEAEAFRSLCWLFRTAGASVASAFRHITDDQFLRLVEKADVPGRLSRFKPSEVSAAYDRAAQRFFNGLLGEPVPAC